MILNPKQLIVPIGRGWNSKGRFRVLDGLLCLISRVIYVSKDNWHTRNCSPFSGRSTAAECWLSFHDNQASSVRVPPCYRLKIPKVFASCAVASCAISPWTHFGDFFQRDSSGEENRPTLIRPRSAGEPRANRLESSLEFRGGRARFRRGRYREDNASVGPSTR